MNEFTENSSNIHAAHCSNLSAVDNEEKSSWAMFVVAEAIFVTFFATNQFSFVWTDNIRDSSVVPSQPVDNGHLLPRIYWTSVQFLLS